jgi:hypothetical protein
MNKDIFFTTQTLGDITFHDLITDLEIMLDDISLLEDIASQLLRQYLSDENLSTLSENSITDRLIWIIYVLKQVK